MSGDAATSASGATLGAASVRTLATRTSMRWLLAIAMPCQSPGAGPGRERAFTEADIRNYGGPNFHVFVNIFDSNTSCLSPQYNSLPYVHVSFAKGYMTHFWKEVLTPTVTRAFDIVALKDADMLLSPHTIQLSEVEYWMRRTNASLIVPTIAPEAPKGRAGRESISIGFRFGANCLAVRTPFAEMVKFARADAYESALWRGMLMPATYEELKTDSYMMVLWCILAEVHFPERPGCVLLRHQLAIHTNAKSISKSSTLDSGYHPERSQVNIVNKLYDLYPWALNNYTWSRQQTRRSCWSAMEPTEGSSELPPTPMTKKDGKMLDQIIFTRDFRPTAEYGFYYLYKKTGSKQARDQWLRLRSERLMAANRTDSDRAGRDRAQAHAM